MLLTKCMKNAYSPVHTCKHTCTHMHTHTCTYTCTHMHTHMYTHVHTHADFDLLYSVRVQQEYQSVSAKPDHKQHHTGLVPPTQHTEAFPKFLQHLDHSTRRDGVTSVSHRDCLKAFSTTRRLQLVDAIGRCGNQNSHTLCEYLVICFAASRTG